jgi:hypothetical protein
MTLVTQIPILGPSLHEIFSYRLTAGLFQLTEEFYEYEQKIISLIEQYSAANAI